MLLDTHILLWFAGEPERLSSHAAAAIEDADECCVSFASAWEYGAKRAKFPKRLPKSFESLMAPHFRPLDIPFELYRFAESLPPIHHDPFDRMLMAQALADDLTLVTADETIRSYPVATLW